MPRRKQPAIPDELLDPADRDSQLYGYLGQRQCLEIIGQYSRLPCVHG